MKTVVPLLALALVCLASRAHAQVGPFVVDVDATQISTANPVPLALGPGCWQARAIPATYTAWNAWGTVSGCGPGGTGCSAGWCTCFRIHTSNGSTTGGAAGPRYYSTPAIALAMSDTVYFVLQQAEVIGISTTDCSGCLSDNLGGVSVELTRLAPPTVAVETVRAGSPPNPTALQPGVTTGPIVGRTWDPVVDHATFATSSVTDFLAISLQGVANASTGLGTLLIAPPFESPVLFSPPGTPFAVPIPNDCSFVGASVWTQGGSVSPGPMIELANALDLVLGTV